VKFISYGSLVAAACLACALVGTDEASGQAKPEFVVQGAQYFVSPDGRPSGQGTETSPWDFQTALNQPAAVKPGDVIWLRAGIYGTGRTQFTSKLAGTAAAPIIVRQWPGERATVNGGVAVYGPYVWFWGFEVTSTVPDRGPNRNALDGFDTYDGSIGTKFINLVIHDDSQGIGFWDKSIDAEINGCIIYHNGFQGSDRGHGHGIYTQNRMGTKRILDNIIFSQFGWGLHAYGSAKAGVEGYQIDGNIVFDNGELSGEFSDNILFAGGAPMSRIELNSNYTYFSRSQGDSKLGWAWSPANGDIVATGNYWIGGYVALEMWNWQSATFTGNTIYTKELINVGMSVTPAESPAKYVWDRNTYFGPALLRVNGENQNLAAWRATGVDSHSKFIPEAPHGVWTFVRPNAYEPGRANIAIYNWDLKKAVPVDLSMVLKPSEGFEIRDAQNYFGEPVVQGVYDGKPVSVPMTGLTHVAPVGDIAHQPQHTAPGFAAFVVLPRQGAKP